MFTKKGKLVSKSNRKAKQKRTMRAAKTTETVSRETVT